MRKRSAALAARRPAIAVAKRPPLPPDHNGMFASTGTPVAISASAMSRTVSVRYSKMTMIDAALSSPNTATTSTMRKSEFGSERRVRARVSRR